MNATKNPTKYDKFRRHDLIAQLHFRDQEIARLRARTIDDYLRELIKEAVDGHGDWI